MLYDTAFCDSYFGNAFNSDRLILTYLYCVNIFEKEMLQSYIVFCIARAHTRTHTHARMHAYARTRTHTHTHTHAHTHI